MYLEIRYLEKFSHFLLVIFSISAIMPLKYIIALEKKKGNYILKILFLM